MDEVIQIIAWEEPPSRKRLGGRRDWSEVAERLRQRPGEWALVLVDDGGDPASSRLKSLPNSILTGSIRSFMPPRTFEATYRLIEDKSHLYVRYVGEGDTPQGDKGAENTTV